MRRRCWCVGGLISLAAASAQAQIATDGSLGKSAQQLSGPKFNISADLGKRAGKNLFHSFSTFNIKTGETADFTGPTSVKNVLARVTGGQPSSIAGKLRVAIPDANFYLMNPAGVIFAPGA